MSVSTAAPSRARLYYERRGSGPLLLLIGSPLDSVGFAPLASALADRYTKAMQKFLAHAGLGAGPAQEADAPQWAPSPERLARMRATTDQFLAHLLRPTTRHRPDIEALQAASTRIVVAAGATSKGSCPTAVRWPWPTSSGRPWSTCPATTADSWPSRSSSAASSTRC
jgi:hypothetical protein